MMNFSHVDKFILHDVQMLTSTVTAYSELEHELTWSGAVNLSLITTPSVVMNLNLTSQNIYSTLTYGLWIFAGPPIYHLSGNVISTIVGFVYINLQP